MLLKLLLLLLLRLELDTHSVVLFLVDFGHASAGRAAVRALVALLRGVRAGANIHEKESWVDGCVGWGGEERVRRSSRRKNRRGKEKNNSRRRRSNNNNTKNIIKLNTNLNKATNK